MEKENVVYICYGMTFHHKEEWRYAILKKMDETGHSIKK